MGSEGIEQIAGIALVDPILNIGIGRVGLQFDADVKHFLGVDMGRVTLEGGSRTTRENARQVAALLGPRCQEPWLLVTSAWHMRRAMAEFEAVGCRVTAYPVDFRTPDTTPLVEYSLARSLQLWQTALHEWLGAAVYAVTR